VRNQNGFFGIEGLKIKTNEDDSIRKLWTKFQCSKYGVLNKAV